VSVYIPLYKKGARAGLPSEIVEWGQKHVGDSRYIEAAKTHQAAIDREIERLNEESERYEARLNAGESHSDLSPDLRPDLKAKYDQINNHIVQMLAESQYYHELTTLFEGSYNRHLGVPPPLREPLPVEHPLD
jgi:hypothetical protein